MKLPSRTSRALATRVDQKVAIRPSDAGKLADNFVHMDLKNEALSYVEVVHWTAILVGVS